MDILKQAEGILKQRRNSITFGFYIGSVNEAPPLGTATTCPECGELDFICVSETRTIDGQQSWLLHCEHCGIMGIARLKEVPV